MEKRTAQEDGELDASESTNPFDIMDLVANRATGNQEREETIAAENKEVLEDAATYPTATDRELRQQEPENCDNNSSSDEYEGRPLPTIQMRGDYSVASSVTSGFRDAELFVPTMYPSTQSVHNVQDAAAPEMESQENVKKEGATKLAPLAPLEEEMEEKELLVSVGNQDQKCHTGKDKMSFVSAIAGTEHSGVSEIQKAALALVLDNEEQAKKAGAWSGGIEGTEATVAKENDPAKSKEMSNPSKKMLLSKTDVDARETEEASFVMEDPARPGLVVHPDVNPEPHHAGPGAYAIAPSGGSGSAMVQSVNQPQPNPTGTNEATDADHGLAEATPVEEDTTNDLEAAKPIDVDELQRRKAKEKKQRQCLALAAFLVVVAAIVLGLTLRNTNDKEDTSSPSSFPTGAPSGSPSSAPTGSLHLLLQDLPDYTLEKLDNYSTPQWKAISWLEDHPDLSDMPEGRKQQLFALATFFYAMEGPSWPDKIRKEWLQYNTDECFWFSSGFGSFAGGSGAFEASSTSNTTSPCNKDKEFQSLFLEELYLSEGTPHIPPEIALLTSLASLELPWNDIGVSINDFLPSTLFQMAHLTVVDLNNNALAGWVPSEFGAMSGLKNLELRWNRLSGSIPGEVGGLTKLTELRLYGNRLTGPIPAQVGFLTNVALLALYNNQLTGSIPAQLGLMTSMTRLMLLNNALSGSVPTQLGLLTSMGLLELSDNSLAEAMPTELGFLTAMTKLHLHTNTFSGQLPSEIGKLSDLVLFDIESNELSGPLPSELGLLSSMRLFWLNSNAFNGTLPQELGRLAFNDSLLVLKLGENNLSGTVSEKICSLGLLPNDASDGLGLSFDCSDELCGCCWCPCSNITTQICSENPLAVYDPAARDEDWPGEFPSPINNSNTITINIRADDWPEETRFEWSVKDEQYGSWKVLESASPTQKNELISSTQQVESDALYRLQLYDSERDGSCCNMHGLGWFTITNSTPSNSYANGTVIWRATGDASMFLLEVYVKIDQYGHAQIEAIVADPIEKLLEDAVDYPGAYPTPLNSSNDVMINIYTDEYPEETSLEWSVQNSLGEWELLDSMAHLERKKTLFSYTKQVESESLYRIRILDSAGDGICCAFEIGWVSITNSTPSQDSMEGTVLWDSVGVFESSLDVFLWIDVNGHAQHVGHLLGQGYALAPGGSVPEEPIIVVPEVVIGNSTEAVNETNVP